MLSCGLPLDRFCLLQNSIDRATSTITPTTPPTTPPIMGPLSDPPPPLDESAGVVAEADGLEEGVVDIGDVVDGSVAEEIMGSSFSPLRNAYPGAAHPSLFPGVA